MKTWLRKSRVSACRHQVNTAIIGLDGLGHLNENATVASSFTSMRQARREELYQRPAMLWPEFWRRGIGQVIATLCCKLRVEGRGEVRGKSVKNAGYLFL